MEPLSGQNQFRPKQSLYPRGIVVMCIVNSDLKHWPDSYMSVRKILQTQLRSVCKVKFSSDFDGSEQLPNFLQNKKFASLCV